MVNLSDHEILGQEIIRTQNALAEMKQKWLEMGIDERCPDCQQWIAELWERHNAIPKTT